MSGYFIQNRLDIREVAHVIAGLHFDVAVLGLERLEFFDEFGD